jgi:hypothetical protein
MKEARVNFAHAPDGLQARNSTGESVRTRAKGPQRRLSQFDHTGVSRIAKR